MVIAQNSVSTTTYSEKENLLVSVYHGRANIELAKEHLSLLMEFYEKNEVKAAIVDLSKVYGSFAKIFEFLDTDFYPHAYTNGLRFQAYVISGDLINENLGEKLILLVRSHNIEVKVFNSLTVAENWIKSVEY